MKRAALLPLALIALFSLAGCAGKQASSLPAPLVVTSQFVLCPRPVAMPELPQLRADEPLDSLDNCDVLMARDDLIRWHIGQLNGALNCYERQAKKEK